MKKIINVLHKLRGKDGCPWDKKQTLQSLKRCLLEETYEVLEAIDSKDSEKITEELGDVLAVISAMIVIGEEKNDYDKKSVIDSIYNKLIRRHPHVFGNKKAKSADHAREFWEEVKAEEVGRSDAKKEKSILDGISHYQPSLLETYRIGKKVARVGFDWNRPSQVMAKMEEELDEIKREIKKGNQKKIKEEIGDFLFSAAHFARHLKTDPEVALIAANKKFRKRFEFMEKEARAEKKKLGSLKPKELEKLWEKAKEKLG